MWKPVFAVLSATILSLGMAAPVQAGESAASLRPTETHLDPARQPVSALPVGRAYALGVTQYDVDSHTQVTGWKVASSVYFGHQDGLDSGLSLVWQNNRNQVSLSRDGLRLTRRF